MNPSQLRGGSGLELSPFPVPEPKVFATIPKKTTTGLIHILTINLGGFKSVATCRQRH
jgi:hypothetical protein